MSAPLAAALLALLAATTAAEPASDTCAVGASGERLCGDVLLLQRSTGVASAVNRVEVKPHQAHESCGDSIQGKNCAASVVFAMKEGIRNSPDLYPGLTALSSIEEVQKKVGGKGCHCELEDSDVVQMEVVQKAESSADECHTALPGEKCHTGVVWAMKHGIRIHPENYGGLTRRSRFEEFQQVLHDIGHEDCPQPCEAAATTPAPCHTALPGEQCHLGVTWAMKHGIVNHPEWYPEIVASGDRSFEAFQQHLHQGGYEGCPAPCASTGTTAAPPATTATPTTTAEALTTTRAGAVTTPGPAAPTTTGATPEAPGGRLSSVRNCYLDPLEEGSGCRKMKDVTGNEMALNEFGQETSGKTACLELMRSVGGNTFMYSLGACEIWQCGSKEDLRNSASAELESKVEVYSELCSFQEPLGGRLGKEARAPVFLKLWEWNYEDVGRECEEYLGPNGFDGIQLSPVVEHVTGHQWWTKYQPVSFGLETRSGSGKDFAAMVARCRAAGVMVSIDLILNHIGTCNKDVCAGWNGTEFGNRWTNGSRGWDAGTQDMFHHKEGHPERQQCGVGPHTGWLCGSPDMRDCSCCSCDMYGMPDWDTAQPSVRELHARHVGELHAIGVTMLRVDASLYQEVDDLAAILNRYPWDLVYQEWWGELPVPERTEFVGHYRDPAYRHHVTQPLGLWDVNETDKVLQVTQGVVGIDPEIAVYPILYHDGRSKDADSDVPTYKNGLEYHQAQKFFLAWPHGISMFLWSGYHWEDKEQGPPGCEAGDVHCSPLPVFDQQGKPQCMGTPSESPLPAQSGSRGWVCEHRWEGLAGMVGFRKACRGLGVGKTWGTPGAEGVDEDAGGLGRIAFAQGEDCFVALVRGHNEKTSKKNGWTFGHLGDWDLGGSALATGLPAGRYCDVASLSDASNNWDRKSCPREVVLGEGGVVESGTVLEGDLLAIYTGARLPTVSTA